jgi:ubiquinol-cytochrome c reductase iron-sulfur subunit
MTSTRHDGAGRPDPERGDRGLSDGPRGDGAHGEGPSVAAEGTQAPQVTEADLDRMTQPQLARLAAELDDVEVVHNQDPWPVPGTRAERRATQSVVLWFLISVISGVAFLFAFLFWPHEYVPPGAPGYAVYAAYTPVVGGTLGLSVLALGIAVIAYVKRFFPDEVSVQQRHDGPSEEIARRAVVAQVMQAGKDTSLGRRKMILGSAGLAAGVLGVGVGIASVAPLVRDPWKGGDDAALWVTPWQSLDGETVYLRYDTGDPEEVALVRPEDQAVNSMMTVFPFRESDRGNEEALIRGLRASDAPAMLIRLRPGTPIVPAPGQEDMHYGDYIAYSKVCTHLGCPASLYEAQTNRILCPCHQSQFIATENARPVFGPAARPLPQLPITVNDEGYFVATGDFTGPVGPAFWEMGKI